MNPASGKALNASRRHLSFSSSSCHTAFRSSKSALFVSQSYVGAQKSENHAPATDAVAYTIHDSCQTPDDNCGFPIRNYVAF